MKNVLIIGNGHDLAHGLKTSYGDFVEFVKNKEWEKHSIDCKIEEEFELICTNNAFIKYFIDYVGTLNTWVDFENELRNITYALKNFFEEITEKMDRLNRIKLNSISDYTVMVLDDFEFIHQNSSNVGTVDQQYYDLIYGVRWPKIKIHLRNELDGLKRALVIYLKYYVPIISDDDGKCYKQLLDIDPHYVFSFNYTDTYTRYGIKNDKSQVLHIHGDLESGKIVLGYDDEDEEELILIQYKKYFQRIQYQLRSINKSIFTSPGKQSGDKDVKDAIAHIFGMSLDRTDEDIIKEIYELSVKTVIYYRVPEPGNMSDYENKVINLIAILGKKEFLSALQSKKIVFEEICYDKGL